jgi:hypothetical protein
MWKLTSNYLVEACDYSDKSVPELFNLNSDAYSVRDKLNFKAHMLDQTVNYQVAVVLKHDLVEDG